MLGDLIKRIKSLPLDRPLITVCGSGYNCSISASMLEQNGITRVSSMDGGMEALPVHRKARQSRPTCTIKPQENEHVDPGAKFFY